MPEAFESGVMLASHTLVLVGVPLRASCAACARCASERYELLRGFFHGAATSRAEDERARLHAVTLERRRTPSAARSPSCGLPSSACRYGRCAGRGARASLAPDEAGRAAGGDIVVLLGQPEALAAAEEKLLRG